MVRVFRSGRELEAVELDGERLEALDSPDRREILEMLAEGESYPAEVANRLNIGKQRAYYHFNRLKDAGLVEETGRRKKSGGEAVYHRLDGEAFVYDTGADGSPGPVPDMPDHLENFLDPLVRDGSIDGKIVTGSPEPHGPDGVRARDGHLAGELACKLGRYGSMEDEITALDTEINDTGDRDVNMVVLGGVLTNTVAKEVNDCFDARFQGESFPYRKIRTPEGTYESDSIGVVAKAESPFSDGRFIYLVAGVRARGTRAAVLAFRDLEEITEDYEGSSFYRVVEGKDLDGDGDIDSYEVVE